MFEGIFYSWSLLTMLSHFKDFAEPKYILILGLWNYLKQLLCRARHLISVWFHSQIKLFQSEVYFLNQKVKVKNKTMQCKIRVMIKNYPTWQNKHHVEILRNFIQPEITISIANVKVSHLNWCVVLFNKNKRIWKWL